MNTTEMLVKLCGTVGVSGMESNAQTVARELLEPLGPCETPVLGGVICRLKTAAPEKPHVLLTAHLDQIGMVVSYIDDKGFLRVSNVGGIDRSMLLATQVTVHTANGPIPGVICTIPPHLNPDQEKIPKMEDISIDVGMTEEQAKEKISLGDRITFDMKPQVLCEDQVCAPAVDDRSGCAAVILAAQKLKDVDLDCSVSVLLTSMEEVGGQGARTAAHQLAPTHAIEVDVSFAHTPGVPRHKCGEMGKGPMITIAPILDNHMFEKMKEVAAANEIPFQVEVSGGSTGTDVDSIAPTREGVRCAILSIPLKYMHSPIEVVKASDVEQIVDLMVAYMKAEFGGNV